MLEGSFAGLFSSHGLSCWPHIFSLCGHFYNLSLLAGGVFILGEVHGGDCRVSWCP